MAISVQHCYQRVRARKTRLESSLPAYTIQWAYHGYCRHCKQEFVVWQGEYPNGNFTTLNQCKVTEIAAWKRRIEQGDFKPQPQFVSEYSQRVAAGADMIRNSEYQLKLIRAHQWWKGTRVDNCL